MTEVVVKEWANAPTGYQDTLNRKYPLSCETKGQATNIRHTWNIQDIFTTNVRSVNYKCIRCGLKGTIEFSI